jgi:hypothetical protein
VGEVFVDGDSVNCVVETKLSVEVGSKQKPKKKRIAKIAHKDDKVKKKEIEDNIGKSELKSNEKPRKNRSKANMLKIQPEEMKQVSTNSSNEGKANNLEKPNRKRRAKN